MNVSICNKIVVFVGYTLQFKFIVHVLHIL